MTITDRNNLLVKWIKPSSENEQDRQERALHMVSRAINGWSGFDDTDYIVYPKGSYYNRTNVRLDSDVDIVVQLQECLYYDYFRDVNKDEAIKDGSYAGSWTPVKWRNEVVAALKDFFGEENVNTDGKIAINIPEVKGSRPSIDIVPSFDYVRYDDALQTPNLANKGSCVFPKGGGLKIVNWPEQQYDNGVLKNDLTTKRYKRFVRALKNAENVLVDAEVIEELPSYFMECLVYNADNSVFYQPGDDLQSAFKRVIIDISSKLENEDRVPMVEPNELKYLFRGESKWSVDKAKTLLNETWNFLGYDED